MSIRNANRQLTIALGLAGALVVGPAAFAQDSAAPAQQAQAGAQDGGEVIARLGDREFTSADIAVAAEDLAETLQQLPADQREAYLLTYLADLERIADAARAASVQDDPAFKSRLQYMQDRTLMETYLQQVGEQAATDAAAQALYQENIGGTEPQQEVKARHILVPSEEEAQTLKQQLDDGADFAKLAEENSKDPGSSPQGGDLGYFTQDQMVPEFSETAFALEPGAVSDPVESQFGWHIIKVEDKRDKEKPSFEQVEGQLKQVLARQAQRDLIMSLREENKIELLGQDGSDLATDAEEGAAAPEAPAEGEAAGESQ